MILPRYACKDCGEIEPMRPENSGLCYRCLKATGLWKGLSPKMRERIRGGYYQYRSFCKKAGKPVPVHILPKQIQNLSVSQILRGWERVHIG